MRLKGLAFWLLALTPAALAFDGPGNGAPPKSIKGWGDVVDPKSDCGFKLKSDRLIITVPGRQHDLSIEAGNTDAPRVIRPVTGDLIADVKVEGTVRPAGDRTSPRYLAYQGTGLLLWQDESTYVRLERAALLQEDGSTVHYINFELRENGERKDARSAEIEDKPAFLRIERRGTRILGAVSFDGLSWSAFEPFEVRLRNDLQIGVAAINTSTAKFEAELADFAVYAKEAERPNP